MLRTTLSRMGHQVVWEMEPMSALNTATSDKPDLVITDFNMPGMSGAELTSELKRRAPDVPVIIYSGQASEITPSPDFSAILKKPILPDELRSAINSAVSY